MSSSLGMTIVLVRKIGISSEEDNLPPHFPQKTVFSGLSKWHLAHFTGMSPPLHRKKFINLWGKCQFKFGKMVRDITSKDKHNGSHFHSTWGLVRELNENFRGWAIVKMGWIHRKTISDSGPPLKPFSSLLYHLPLFPERKSGYSCLRRLFYERQNFW